MKSTKTDNGSDYNYECEYCHGVVRPKLIEREAFKHKNGFIILEGVVVGVCDVCGVRFYSASILHAVHELATGSKPSERMEQVPVAHFAPS